jgi:hypothetical protein
MWTPRPTVNPRKPHGGPHEPRGPYEVLFNLTVTFEVTLSGTLGSRLYFTARQEGPRAKFSNDPTSHDPYTPWPLVLTIYGGRWDGIVRARRGWMKYPGPRLHPLVTSSIHVRTSSAESSRAPRCGVHNVGPEYFKACPAPRDSRVAGPRPRVSRARGLAGPPRANLSTCFGFRLRHDDHKGRKWGGTQNLGSKRGPAIPQGHPCNPKP